MPSKNGFGNSRTPMKKVGYGSAMHYKNPVKMTAAQETLPENLKAGIRAKEEKQAPTKMYDKSPVKGVKVKPRQTTSGSKKKVDGPVAKGNKVDIDMTQFNDKLRTKDGKVLTKKQYADSKLKL
jgi:hypothetical protein